MNQKSVGCFGCMAVLFVFVLWCAFWGTIARVGWHFIAKFW